MADEPTAIRNPNRGRTHRAVPEYWSGMGYLVNAACGAHISNPEHLPITRVPAEDRCYSCWRETP